MRLRLMLFIGKHAETIALLSMIGIVVGALAHTLGVIP